MSEEMISTADVTAEQPKRRGRPPKTASVVLPNAINESIPDGPRIIVASDTDAIPASVSAILEKCVTCNDTKTLYTVAERAFDAAKKIWEKIEDEDKRNARKAQINEVINTMISARDEDLRQQKRKDLNMVRLAKHYGTQTNDG